MKIACKTMFRSGYCMVRNSSLGRFDILTVYSHRMRSYYSSYLNIQCIQPNLKKNLQSFVEHLIQIEIELLNRHRFHTHTNPISMSNFYCTLSLSNLLLGVLQQTRQFTNKQRPIMNSNQFIKNLHYQ